MRPLISVIVPVYNAKPYLDRCVQSIIHQTYENNEIILVDDGSNDGSEKMCDDYASSNKNIKTFHINNSGPSVARNYGVGVANGDLISFIDSDDYVTADYLEYLFMLMDMDNADVSCSDLSENETPSEDGSYKEEVLNAETAIIRSCYNEHVSISPCAKLYKKHILKKHPFPDGRIYEDLATIYKLFSECDQIAVSTKKSYIVIKRPGSIQRRAISEEQFDHLIASEDQIEYMKKNYPNAVDAAKYRCVSNAIEMISRHNVLKCDNSKNNFRRIRNYIKKYTKDVLHNKHTSINTKISIMIIMLGYYPVKLLWPIREMIRTNNDCRNMQAKL